MALIASLSEIGMIEATNGSFFSALILEKKIIFKENCSLGIS